MSVEVNNEIPYFDNTRYEGLYDRDVHNKIERRKNRKTKQKMKKLNSRECFIQVVESMYDFKPFEPNDMSIIPGILIQEVQDFHRNIDLNLIIVKLFLLDFSNDFCSIEFINDKNFCFYIYNLITSSESQFISSEEFHSGECYICLEERNDMRKMSCNHSFCQECIQLMCKRKSSYLCPLCRTKICEIKTHVNEEKFLKPLSRDIQHLLIDDYDRFRELYNQRYQCKNDRESEEFPKWRRRSITTSYEEMDKFFLLRKFAEARGLRVDHIPESPCKRTKRMFEEILDMISD